MKIKHEAKMLSLAISLAAEAHQDQFDKGGKPYILHPLRLMDSFEDYTLKIVAVLHDVIEDTHVTLNQLQDAGFSEEVMEACLH